MTRKTAILRRLAAVGLVGSTVGMLASVSPARANSTTEDATSSTVVDTETAGPSEFSEASARIERTLAADVAETSAEMGVLVDDSEVDVERAPGVGYIAGTERSLDSVSSVSVTESEISRDKTVVGKEFEYALVTTTPSNVSDLHESTASGNAAVPQSALPLGPGSMSVKFFNQAPCAFLYGSDTGNYVTACETLGYEDGGNGRQPYGVADDDGSKYYDWFTYHQWGTIHPSDSGLDWIITGAQKTSHITGASISAGNPGTTDYTPNESSCDGALTMSAGFIFDFEGSLCVSGREIFHPDGYGSMGQKFKPGLVAPDDSKSLNYRIAIRIKQGVKPDWYTVNTASFRKQFSLTTNKINSTS